MRRTGSLVLALTFAFCGLSALPAYADDDPSGYGSPGDPFGGQTIPPGPVYVLTPGASPGTGLPASSDPDDVEKQIQKDIKKNQTATDAPSGAPTSTSTATPVAGTTQDADEASDATDTSTVSATKDEDGGSKTWVVVVAALLALVVAGGAFRFLQLRRRTA